MQPTTQKPKRGRPATTEPAVKPERPQIKCKNCRVKFTPIREDQKFHTAACRKEFHQYGKMSVAKLAERVERRIKPAMRAEFSAQIKHLESLIAGLNQRTDAA